MEMLTMICEKLWIVMMLAAFFICLAKGWLRKGFYITRERISGKAGKREKTAGDLE